MALPEGLHEARLADRKPPNFGNECSMVGPTCGDAEASHNLHHGNLRRAAETYALQAGTYCFTAMSLECCRVFATS